ncbi:MAG: class E sortase [Acidimicrobiia bacterium]
MRDPWEGVVTVGPPIRRIDATHRRNVRRALAAAVATGMVVLGLGLLALPAFEQAVGEWNQQALAVERDARIPRYGNAVSAAYGAVSSDFESEIVSFEVGALPQTADGQVIVLPSPDVVDASRSAPDPALAPAVPAPPATPEVAPAPPPSAFVDVTIRIPSIGVAQAVVEGVGRTDLKMGPGHYPGTAYPGYSGNVVVSGHRTTFTKPFYDIDLLQPGDVIVLDTPTASHRYLVQHQHVVAPTDLSPLRATDAATLTLTTCTPKGSARERLIVVAQLESPPLDIAA